MTREAGHEPLIAFTSLAIAGAGALVLSAWPGLDPAAVRIGTWTGIGLIGAGLATSTWHLGRRDRAWLAARGMFRSPVSNEGALGTLTLAAALVAATGLAGAAMGTTVQIAAAVCALAFLVSIGLVYRLGGQLTWMGFSAWTSVTAGLAFGAILVDSLPPSRLASTVTLVCIAVDAFVFSQRWRRIVQLCLEHRDSLGPAFDRRHELLAARFLLVNALPCLILFLWPSLLAAAVALAGIVVDRMGFYELALQHRTEVEIRRVESLLDSRTPPFVP